jgi:hypothetical protein
MKMKISLISVADGVLLITDYVARPSLKEADKKNLSDAFYVQSFKTLEEYPACLEHNGFQLLELHDISDHTLTIKKNKDIERFNTNKKNSSKLAAVLSFMKTPGIFGIMPINFLKTISVMGWYYVEKNIWHNHGDVLRGFHIH